MISNIINTIFTRVSLAVLSVVLLIINSNYLGDEGLGTVGLIVLEIVIYLLISNLICGGSLVYFASRKNQTALLLLSYGWIAVSALFYYFLVQLIPSIQSPYSIDILLLGVLQSGIGAHINLMAGKQRIKQFNAINLLQTATHITAIVIFYVLLQKASVRSFVLCTYIAYGITFIVSFIQLSFQLEKKIILPNFQLFKELFYYGFFIQLSNLAQLFNYRLSYFILDFFSGRASVGRYAAGVQLSEGILLPAKSISTVQYAKIANIKSTRRAALLTIKLFKLTLLLSSPLLFVIVLIPDSWYAAILGDDFSQTPSIILFMAGGIMALAGEYILSRYFSGTGQQKINAYSTIIGLVVTLIFGFSLIPILGIFGAALTSTASFLSMLLYMLNRIIVKEKLKLSDFLFRKEDYVFMRRVARLLRSKL